MALTYRTDKKTIRNTILFFKEDGKEGMKWHLYYRACMDKGVTQSHFSTFVKESTFFTRNDEVMYELFENDALYVVQQNKKNASEAWTYEIDTEKAGKTLLKLAKEKVGDVYSPESIQELRKKVKSFFVGNAYRVEPEDDEVENEGDELNESFEELGVSRETKFTVGKLDKALDNVKFELEIIARDGIDPERQKTYLESATSSSLHCENYEEREHCAQDITDNLRGMVYAHRGHSVFYAIFHPFKYHAETVAINGAKDALVNNLQADRKSVEKLVANYEKEDKCLRDKKDFHQASLINELTMEDEKLQNLCYKGIDGLAGNGAIEEELDESFEINPEEVDLNPKAEKQVAPVEEEPQKEAVQQLE